MSVWDRERMSRNWFIVLFWLIVAYVIYSFSPPSSSFTSSSFPLFSVDYLSFLEQDEERILRLGPGATKALQILRSHSNTPMSLAGRGEGRREEGRRKRRWDWWEEERGGGMRRGEDKQTCKSIYFACIILLYPMSLAGRGDKMKVKEKKGSMWKLKRGEKKRRE